jgi:hypothetical protein
MQKRYQADVDAYTQLVELARTVADDLRELLSVTVEQETSSVQPGNREPVNRCQLSSMELFDVQLSGRSPALLYRKAPFSLESP